MSEPVRVAQVVGRMDGYGVEQYVMNYYRCIDRSRIQFDFFVHDDSSKVPREEIEAMGGRVYIIPNYWHVGGYLRALRRLFRQNRYPIVHAHIGVISVLPLFAAWWAGVPIRIAHNHTSTAKGETRNVIKYVLRPFIGVFATHYIAVSTLVGAWLFGKRAMARGKVTIFHPVIDVQAYRYDEAVRTQVRKELNLDGRFVVGHVGRFCYQKNHAFLLDIFQAVHAKQPNALLMLVGDGELREEIEHKADALGLRDDVLMLGNRDDVNRLYQAMDVFVLPSRYEGFGIVNLEAQAAGLKVVTSISAILKAKVREDMTFLELSDGPERWAEEALRAGADERASTEDFSTFDRTIQAGRMEQYYLEMLHAQHTGVERKKEGEG